MDLMAVSESGLVSSCELDMFQTDPISCNPLWVIATSAETQHNTEAIKN